MPQLNPEYEEVPVKMLLLGESGTGKTGALASLLPKYRLIVQDFDGNISGSWLANKLRQTPEVLDKFYFRSYADKVKLINNTLVPDGAPTAWRDALKDLTNWRVAKPKSEWADPSKPEYEEDLGPSSTWGTDTVYVCDSFSFMGKAAFRYVDAINNFKDGRQTYFEAQKQLEAALALLCSDAIRCHVILTAHITLVDLENGLSKQYPATVGKAFGPTVPKYLDTMLEVRSKIESGIAKRVIRTVPSALLDTKHPVVAGLPAELPLETGLATFFKANTTGEKPPVLATDLAKIA